MAVSRNYAQSNGMNNGFLSRMSPQNITSAGASGGSGINSLFGGNNKNPANAASPYIDQARNELPNYYQPYINAGNNQIPGLEKGYSDMTDPNSFIKNIGQGYQASPGYEWQKNQGLQGVQNAAAAGGMLGSPQHQQEAATLTSGLANQDYNNYLDRALNTYNQGMQGKQGLYNTGAESSMNLGNNMAGLSLQQANLSYAGQKEQNQEDSDTWSNIFKGAGAILPYFL